MKNINLPMAVWVILLGVIFSSTALANTMLLLDKHTSKGVSCVQCHGVSNPTKAAPVDKCLPCHGGSYETLAKKTEKMDPNPHYTHLGDMPCNECHHVHKPSVNMCSNCHNIKMNVP